MFSVISKVEIWDLCKLLLIIKIKAGQGFVLSFYIFNLFNSLFIILVDFQGFCYKTDINSAKAKIIVNLIFIQIIIVPHNILGSGRV